MYSIQTCLLFISLISFVFHSFSLHSENICLEKGFYSDTLQCKTCETLNQIVADAELYDDCVNCCIPPPVNENLYESIVLEIDKRYVDAYPSISSVLKKKKTLKLKLKYRFGVSPTLHLYQGRNDATAADSISISSWSQDTIEDFIKSHQKVSVKSEGSAL